MEDPRITFKTKLQIFNATSRSILCYGALVWGCNKYNQVEKLLGFFLKKLFKLSMHAKSSLLYSEFQVSSLYFSHLNCTLII